jgi:AraC family transcriptional regulator
MQIDIVERPARRLAAIRHVGPYPGIGRAFGQLAALAGAAGLLQRPEAAMIGVYYDDPTTTAPTSLQSDAAVTVQDGVALPDGLTERQLPAGRYAHATHVGGYEGLPQAWQALRDWLPGRGERWGAGPSYEHYVSDMATTPKDQLRTDLYMPLA